MPFTGAGSPVTLGWLQRQLANSACPVTAEEIAFLKAVAGAQCAEDVVAPEYALAIFVIDGGAVVLAQYIVDTVNHTLSINGTAVEEETLPLTLAQELSCRDLFDASCP